MRSRVESSNGGSTTRSGLRPLGVPRSRGKSRSRRRRRRSGWKRQRPRRRCGGCAADGTSRRRRVAMPCTSWRRSSFGSWTLTRPRRPPSTRAAWCCACASVSWQSYWPRYVVVCVASFCILLCCGVLSCNMLHLCLVEVTRLVQVAVCIMHDVADGKRFVVVRCLVLSCLGPRALVSMSLPCIFFRSFCNRSARSSSCKRTRSRGCRMFLVG